MDAGTQIGIDFIGSDADAARSIAKLQTQVAKLRGELQGVGRAGKESAQAVGQGMGETVSSHVTRLITAYASLYRGIQLATSAYSTWQEQLKSVGRTANEAAKSMAIFDILQTPLAGRRNKAAAIRLAGEYGFKDQAQIAETAQMAQSGAGGDFEKSLPMQRATYQMARLGMTQEGAREMLLQASIQGSADPVGFAQAAFTIGKLTKRKAEDVAKAVQGMYFIADKNLGLALAGVIAEAKPEKAATYLRAFGALSGEFEPKEFRRMVRKLGLPREASQEQILTALHVQGYDTPAKISKLGVAEIRRSEIALIAELNYDRIMAYKAEAEKAQATPDMFDKELRNLYAVDPQLAATVKQEAFEARTAQVMTTGKFATEAQAAMTQQALYGAALTRRGITSVGPWVPGLGRRLFDATDAEGRTSPFRQYMYRLANFMEGNLFGGQAEQQQAQYDALNDLAPGESSPVDYGRAPLFDVRDVKQKKNDFQPKTLSDFSRAVGKLKDAAEEMRGGPALVPATEDY